MNPYNEWLSIFKGLRIDFKGYFYTEYNIIIIKIWKLGLDKVLNIIIIISMTKKFNDGDYLGIVGSYSGLVYLNGKWHKYECGGCLRGLGILKNRLNNGSHKIILGKFKTMQFEYKHDIELHKKFLESKKSIMKW